MASQGDEVGFPHKGNRPLGQPIAAALVARKRNRVQPAVEGDYVVLAVDDHDVLMVAIDPRVVPLLESINQNLVKLNETLEERL